MKKISKTKKRDYIILNLLVIFVSLFIYFEYKTRQANIWQRFANQKACAMAKVVQEDKALTERLSWARSLDKSLEYQLELSKLFAIGAENRYKYAKQNTNRMIAYVRAGLVADAYWAIQDEEKYEYWKKIQVQIEIKIKNYLKRHYKKIN